MNIFFKTWNRLKYSIVVKHSFQCFRRMNIAPLVLFRGIIVAVERRNNNIFNNAMIKDKSANIRVKRKHSLNLF